MNDELREILVEWARYFVQAQTFKFPDSEVKKQLDYTVAKLQPYIDRKVEEAKKVTYKKGLEAGRKFEQGIQAEDRDYKSLVDGT